MSLLEKVTELKKLLGVQQGSIIEAVAACQEVVGIVPDPGSTLPQMVEALWVVVGCKVNIKDSHVSQQPKLIAVDNNSERVRSEKALQGKRKLSGRETEAEVVDLESSCNNSADTVVVDSVAPVKGKKLKEQDLRRLPGIAKFFVPKKAIQAVAAASDKAQPHDDLMDQVRLQVKELPSEICAAKVESAQASYSCEICARTFSTAIGLRNHTQWHYETWLEKAAQEQTMESCSKLAPPLISVQLKLGRSGDDWTLATSISINGKNVMELRREREAREASKATFEEALRERQIEAKRRAERKRMEKESEQAALAGEQRCGSARRRSYSAKEKLDVLEYFDRVRADGSIVRKLETFEADPRSRGVRWCMVRKWDRRVIERAAAQAHAGTLLRIDKESRRKGRYAAMEKRLYALFKLRRSRGRKVSAKWFVHMARHLMQTEFAQNNADFRGSRTWMRRFLRRFQLVRRKKTNVKNTTWEETKPVLQRYFRATRRRLRDVRWREASLAIKRAEQEDHLDQATLERAKWGKYLPHQRFNVDQVPLPFIFEMDYTYEQKGAKRVAINQLGPALSKRQCTAQVCFRPAEPTLPSTASPEEKAKFERELMRQPPPCIIFRGQGLQISQREQDAYPEDLCVLWQPKAWVDRPVAVKWAKECFKKVIVADKAAGVVDEHTRYLLIQDNLDSQVQPEYLQFLSNECYTDDHKVPPNKTDQVQPVDRGMGRLLKIYIGQEEDQWLEDDENLRKWENNALTASDRRILIANWYCRAYKRACETAAKRKFFEHAGALLTADGSDDGLIKLEGVPQGETFSWEDDMHSKS